MKKYWFNFVLLLLFSSKYLLAASTIPAIIEAENYGNMSGVLTEATTDAGGGANVGWVDKDDWLVYDINVPTAGSYTIQYRVASPNPGGVLSSDLGAGATQLGRVVIPNTGGWQNWTTVSQTVSLPAGSSNLGIFVVVGGFNINWINVVSNDQARFNPDLAFAGFNNAFLVTTNAKTFYKKSIGDGAADGTWVAALDIFVAQDAYDRTGRTDHKELVYKLCKTWLENTPIPWTWDGWNDDIGWFSLAMIRGYQITGEKSFLDAARYGFDMAWARGWDTEFNGGGIWEQQPEMTPAGEPIGKEALSNDSLGKAAALIYQSTQNRWYLDRATQIHEWVVNHIYNQSTGQVYTGVDRDNKVNTGFAVYNQGTFIDYTHLLYLITGERKYYDFAKKTIDYTKNRLNSGVINNNANYLNTWADEMARGLGHFVRDHREWNTYYSWMETNANAIWNNRRTDYNITWNGFAEKTSRDNNIATSKFASAAAWLQYTPTTIPNGDIGGIHVIVNKKYDVAIDAGGETQDGEGVIQWGTNYGQNQRWLFSQNEDNSWNIVSMFNWKSLEIPAADNTNGVQAVTWSANRNDNQRWLINKLDDGSYRITNKATGKVLDNASSANSNSAILQWGWNGEDQQRWLLK